MSIFLFLIKQINKVEQSFLAEEPLIVVLLGNGTANKSASPTLWANIVKGFMVRLRRKVCLVVGPEDTDSLRKVQGLLPYHLPAILEGFGPPFIVQILQKAQLFIGKDSGLSHLTASLGCLHFTVLAQRSCQVGAMGKACCCDATFLPLCGERCH